ncbi:DUF6850 family outer membrane beta-barrel protein [Tannerella sp.]|uniref:DUF6850 family outer membrane beta-barrel protein n=1 Tax=Tannerella sp. TaxID=2382127 RepID=UPI0026DC0FA7|nr:DUF6850 family outer membrane beta-barrel protein [Tannerella sp.]MDO4702949.1 hypothetical protein [Tannerella sp.]
MLRDVAYIMLFTVLCLCPSRVEAEAVDSITHSVMTHSLRNEMYRKTMETPMSVRLLPRSSFGHTALAYQHASGELMRVQMPERLQDVLLTSIGLYSAERWQVYGEFAYHRTFSDSVQWLLSEKPRDGMPYYFASPQKGNWETETYDINGNFNIDLSQSLVVGASASIRYFKGTRSNDPRPSAESFRSHYDVYAGLRFPKLSLTVEGGLGYGTRDNNIVYRNTDNDRPIRLDKMAYEFMGFGINRKTQKFQNRDLETNLYAQHIGVQLESRLSNAMAVWGRWAYDRQQDSIRRSRTTNVNRSLLSTYTVHTASLTLGATWSPSDKINWETLLFLDQAKGSDQLTNILQGQKNYVYNHTDFGFRTWMNIKHNPRRTDCYGMTFSRLSERRADGSSEHLFRINRTEASIMWGQQRVIRSSYCFSYHLRQGLEIPRSTLTYPESQINIFTTDVAVPLSHYYHTDKGYTNVHAVIGKQFGTSILSLSFDYNILYLFNRSPYLKGVRNTFTSALTLSF